MGVCRTPARNNITFLSLGRVPPSCSPHVALNLVRCAGWDPETLVESYLVVSGFLVLRVIYCTSMGWSRPRKNDVIKPDEKKKVAVLEKQFEALREFGIDLEVFADRDVLERAVRFLTLPLLSTPACVDRNSLAMEHSWCGFCMCVHWATERSAILCVGRGLPGPSPWSRLSGPSP